MGEFLKSIVCTADNCMCWLIVLLNILAVFFLVFCSFYKITKITRIFGWIYAGMLLCGTVGIVFLHTCIFTLLCAVFTALIIMAILAVILPERRSDTATREVKSRNVGCYVIHPIIGGAFYFALYDKRRRYLARSKEEFAQLSNVKDEIKVCRSLGESAGFEDTTQLWILEVEHPRFEMIKDGEKYFFRLCADVDRVLLQSEAFDEAKMCNNMMKKAMQAVRSRDIYIDSESKVIVMTAQAEEKTEYIPAEEHEPIVEPAPEPQTQTIEIEPEIIENGIEVVGVIWPENAGKNDLMYYYDSAGYELSVGDTVLVPTQDSERIVKISKGNHRIPEDKLLYPLKKVIRIIKKSM